MAKVVIPEPLKTPQQEHAEVFGDRTEAEIIAQAPLTVRLGGDIVEIKPLCISESRKWRVLFSDRAKELTGECFKIRELTPAECGDTFSRLFISAPETLGDLFFAYAKDLDRAKIEETATDGELLAAFMGVFKYAFPLLDPLAALWGLISNVLGPE